MTSVPFKTILVAVDESNVSKKAFTAAVTLAKSLFAKLTIVHVLNPHDIRSPQSPYANYPSEAMRTDENLRQKFEAEWLAYVESYEAMLKQKTDEAIAVGIEADFAHPHGPTGSTLCELARVTDASLLIVGSHQRRGMAEMMLGSVSNYVVHHAPCSVLVIYPDQVTLPATAQTVDSSQTKETAAEANKATSGYAAAP